MERWSVSIRELLLEEIRPPDTTANTLRRKDGTLNYSTCDIAGGDVQNDVFRKWSYFQREFNFQNVE
jgi:arginyl-tRNA synthetase